MYLNAFIALGVIGLIDKAVVAERIVLPVVGDDDVVGHLGTEEGEGVDYFLGEFLVLAGGVDLSAGVVVYQNHILGEAIDYELGEDHDVHAHAADSTLRNFGPCDGLVVGVHQDKEKRFVDVEVVVVELAGELCGGERVFNLFDCWDCVGGLLASDFNALNGVGGLFCFHCEKF